MKELFGVRTKWNTKKKNISDNLLATKMKRTEIFLVLSILAISKSKIVMYEKLYDYVKQKYGGKAELCYMNTDDTDGFIVNRNGKHLHKCCKRYWSYELEKMLPRVKNKKAIGLIKD